MSLLSVKSLSLTLAIPLIHDLSFSVEPGDRLGLIAANGRGKSSLLRCLSGQLEPTSGDITRARGTTVALVEQDAPAALLPLPRFMNACDRPCTRLCAVSSRYHCR